MTEPYLPGSGRGYTGRGIITAGPGGRFSGLRAAGVSCLWPRAPGPLASRAPGPVPPGRWRLVPLGPWPRAPGPLASRAPGPVPLGPSPRAAWRPCPVPCPAPRAPDRGSSPRIAAAGSSRFACCPL
ncbi:hypothetical protein C4B68_13500 [Streptomyces dengpaensis]|uniref:Uncharacterized protein n=1 Tax=Streptomyces dengpaensis TaxID=2049881 RepID=A0ABM6SPK5_9ACTN|nr:hypothetical protein C4B68_13500 [Streptomyces dengpaensis]